MKRNYISEILEVKGRLAAHRRLAAKSKLNEIGEIWQRNKENSDMYLYFPVALIAVLVTNCKFVAADLIDNNDVFFDNALQKLNIKIDPTILNAIRGNEVSAGELIAHTLAFNRLEDIDKEFSSITGEDFFNLMRLKIGERKFAPLLAWDEIGKTLSLLFRMRHILAHELTRVEIDQAFIQTSIDAVSLFVDESIYVGLGLLYPQNFTTQAEMNTHAAKELSRSQEEHKALVAKILSLEGGGWPDYDYQPEIEAFYRACEIGATAIGKAYEGGSIQPLFYARRFKELLDHEIKRLKLLLRERTEGW